MVLNMDMNERFAAATDGGYVDLIVSGEDAPGLIELYIDSNVRNYASVRLTPTELRRLADSASVAAYLAEGYATS